MNMRVTWDQLKLICNGRHVLLRYSVTPSNSVNHIMQAENGIHAHWHLEDPLPTEAEVLASYPYSTRVTDISSAGHYVYVTQAGATTIKASNGVLHTVTVCSRAGAVDLMFHDELAPTTRPVLRLYLAKDMSETFPVEFHFHKGLWVNSSAVTDTTISYH